MTNNRYKAAIPVTVEPLHYQLSYKLIMVTKLYLHFLEAVANLEGIGIIKGANLIKRIHLMIS